MKLYVIRNLTNGREYVGITVRTLAARWINHKSAAFGKWKATPLYTALREHGFENFTMVLLGTAATHEELQRMEEAAIRDRGTLYPGGYNLARGGRDNTGWHHSEASKQEMSRKHLANFASGRDTWSKGKTMTPEFRAHVSAGQRKRLADERARGFVRQAWNKGVPHTSEARAKMSARRCGRPLSPAHIQALTGLKRSPETCERIAANKRAWWATRRVEQQLYADFT